MIFNIFLAALLITFFVVASPVVGQQPISGEAGSSGLPVNLATVHDSAGLLSGNQQWTGMPSNPEFIEYQQQLLSGNLSAGNRTHGLGYIPSPVKQVHENSDLKMLASFRRMASYPAVYDLRTLGRVTPVKDQGSAGTCWAFATYGSLESNLMPSESRDFSENNLKNNAGFDMDVNNGGGNIDMATAYLTRWAGPVNETDDPYNPGTTTSPSGLTVQKHVQDVLYLTSYDGPSDGGPIKAAVMSDGAVWAFMAWGDAYYNSMYHSYYYSSGGTEGGHAVTIVGWDDNYDLNKFNAGNRPPGNGAFIVKNSWGTGWGESGYFYVSYYDSVFADACAVFIPEPSDNYDHIYQYDPLGWTYNIVYYGDAMWMANLFTAGSDEMLDAVGFYVPEENDIYDIYVFDEDGLIATKTGIINPPMGYHTFRLDTPVALQAGQRFTVEVRVDCPGSLYSYVCAEMPYNNYCSRATADALESFISVDGQDWYDVTDGFPDTNVCLKAYTSDPVTLQLSPVTYSVNKNAGTATLTITKTGSSGQNSIVSYSTANGTALAGKDFTAKSGEITFLPSETTKTITVDILDAQGFDNRQFFVNLSAPVNAAIGADASATITILNSHKPIQTVLAPAMVPGHQATGGASGRITNPNTTIGIASAYVAIVNASNTSQSYYVSQAHPDGTFEFASINNTYTTSGYQSKYRLYANHSLFGEGFSNNFTVYEGATAAVNAAINMLPAHIAIIPDNSTIVANASDNVTVSACVTDLLNGPVANGFAVIFSLNDTTTGSGLFGPESGNTPVGNTITATTVNGYAKVRFGWATRNGAINIRAAWAVNASVYGTNVESVLQSPPPAIGFSTSSRAVSENAGTVAITLQKNGYAAADASVSYSTGGGNATVGSNYLAASGTIVFHPFETVKTFTVPILDDGMYGRQKVFLVSLSGPVNAGLATNSMPVYIDNIDSPPILYLDVASVSAYDNSGTVTINVTKTGNTELNARVDYLTLNGTAKSGQDFTNASGTLTFAPGETRKTVTITILPNVTYEDEETFNVLLSDPDNATLNTSKTAIVRIISNIPHNQTIHVIRGWNLVSFQLTPVNDSISSVISPEAMANIRIIWNYNNSNPDAPVWKFYKPNRTVNTLMNLTSGMGFWVLANSDFDLNVSGITPIEMHVRLNKGWNMVGPEGMSTRTPAEQYGAYYLTWSYKNGQWYYYKPSRTVNTLTEIKPGQGYWVLVK